MYLLKENIWHFYRLDPRKRNTFVWTDFHCVIERLSSSEVRRIRLINSNPPRAGNRSQTNQKIFLKSSLIRSENEGPPVNPGRHDAGDQFGRLNRSNRMGARICCLHLYSLKIGPTFLGPNDPFHIFCKSLLSSLFYKQTCSRFTRLVVVCHHAQNTTLWCFRPYKPYIFWKL